jgi:predicted GNAT family acetyltransferase
MAQVETSNNEAAHRYEARVGEEIGGFAVYALRDGVIDFQHTEVDDALEGQGVGSSLARAALDDVRRRGDLTVVASCPFIAEWIDRHPDYQDLLAR